MKRILFAVILLLSVPVMAEERYLCVESLKTGFKYNKSLKQWKPTHFETDARHIISISSKEGFTFSITEAGRVLPSCTSKKGVDSHGQLFCGNELGQFNFNRETGRFLSSWMFGYILGDYTGYADMTPFISIGKCSPF